METRARMIDFQKIDKPVLDSNTKEPLNGTIFQTYFNRWGYAQIGMITRWKNGRLHADGGEPAVECDDGHCEYYTEGLLNNTNLDSSGKQFPAVVFGDYEEYWVEGQKIQNPNNSVRLKWIFY